MRSHDGAARDTGLMSHSPLDKLAGGAGLRSESRAGDWTGSPAGNGHPMVVGTYRSAT